MAPSAEGGGGRGEGGGGERGGGCNDCLGTLWFVCWKQLTEDNTVASQN